MEAEKEKKKTVLKRGHHTKNNKLSTKAKLILAILMTENSIHFISLLGKETISPSIAETIYHTSVVSSEGNEIIMTLCGLCN